MNPLRASGNIQKRILAITTSCILAMCILISCVSYYIFRNYLQHSLIQAAETNLQLLSDSIDGSFKEIDQMVRFCQTNSNIASYIAANPDPGSVLSVSTYDRMAEEFNSNPSNNYMTRLAVITDSHFLQIVNVAYSSTSNLAEETPKLPFFETLLGEPGYAFSTGFIKDPFYKKGKDVLPILRPITYRPDTGQGAYLLIEVSAELFTHAFRRYPLAEDSNIYLTVGEHHYRCENGVLLEFEPVFDRVQELSDTAIVRGNRIHQISGGRGGSMIMVTSPLNMPDCYISQNISPLELRSQKRLLWYILGGILVGIVGFGVLLMFTLNRMIHLPVARIRGKMLRIAQGDFERDSSIEWNHELGDIGRGVNDLCENVLLLMQSRLEDERQKKDLEYRMLQSQVNPHFLYNTLNSIKWMASIQGAEGICEMATALAKLLKSISKGTRLLVPIREELSLLQDYFTIQRYRYGGTVTMDIQIEDEEILDCRILQFTLQPLVENAIFHGIEPKGTGHITIRGVVYAAEEPAGGAKRDGFAGRDPGDEFAGGTLGEKSAEGTLGKEFTGKERQRERFAGGASEDEFAGEIPGEKSVEGTLGKEFTGKGRLREKLVEGATRNEFSGGIPGEKSAGATPAGEPRRNIRIDVTDDGVGMSPEKAASILLTNEDASTDFFREIGVSNVHKRLQYEFGEAYGITVESVEGEYTTMSVHIPFGRD